MAEEIAGHPAMKDPAAQLNELMEYVEKQRAEYAFIASQSNKRGLEAKKLAAECREVAYFDVIMALERIRNSVLRS